MDEQYSSRCFSRKKQYISISQMQEISDRYRIELRRETDRLQMSSNAFSAVLKEEMQT